MSLMPWSSHSATTGSGTSSRTPICGCLPISHDTTPSSASPTPRVSVSTTGTSRKPAWFTQCAPVISPLPLRSYVAAATRWYQMSSLGTMLVAPVRTFVPSTLVTCATRTPATSVMPSTAPVENLPMGTGVRALAGSAPHASTSASARSRRIVAGLADGDRRTRFTPQRLVLRAKRCQSAGFDAAARVRPVGDRLGEQALGQRVVAGRPAQARVDRALALPRALRRGAQACRVRRDTADRAPQRRRLRVEVLEAVAHELAQHQAVPRDRAVFGFDRVPRARRVAAVFGRVAQVAVVRRGAVVARAARARRQAQRIRRQRARLVARQLEALAVHREALRAAADARRRGAHAVRQQIAQAAALRARVDRGQQHRAVAEAQLGAERVARDEPV